MSLLLVSIIQQSSCKGEGFEHLKESLLQSVYGKKIKSVCGSNSWMLPNVPLSGRAPGPTLVGTAATASQSQLGMALGGCLSKLEHPQHQHLHGDCSP